jgi:hypothetical protein
MLTKMFTPTLCDYRRGSYDQGLGRAGIAHQSGGVNPQNGGVNPRPLHLQEYLEQG